MSASHTALPFDEYVEVLVKIDGRFNRAAKYTLARYLRAVPQFNETTSLVKAVIFKFIADGQFSNRSQDYGTAAAESALDEMKRGQFEYTKHEKVLVQAFEKLEREIAARIIFGKAELQKYGPGAAETAPPDAVPTLTYYRELNADTEAEIGEMFAGHDEEEAESSDGGSSVYVASNDTPASSSDTNMSP